MTGFAVTGGAPASADHDPDRAAVAELDEDDLARLDVGERRRSAST